MLRIDIFSLMFLETVTEILNINLAKSSPDFFPAITTKKGHFCPLKRYLGDPNETRTRNFRRDRPVL